MTVVLIQSQRRSICQALRLRSWYRSHTAPPLASTRQYSRSRPSTSPTGPRSARPSADHVDDLVAPAAPHEDRGHPGVAFHLDVFVVALRHPFHPI